MGVACTGEASRQPICSTAIPGHPVRCWLQHHCEVLSIAGHAAARLSAEREIPKLCIRLLKIDVYDQSVQDEAGVSDELYIM